MLKTMLMMGRHDDERCVHLSRFYTRLELDRWFLAMLMGIVIGLIAVLLKQSITALGNLQWTRTKSYLKACVQ